MGIRTDTRLTATEREMSVIPMCAEDHKSAGIFTHGLTDHVEIVHNDVKACGGGIIARGRNTTIAFNEIRGSKTIVESGHSYIHGIHIGDNNGNQGAGLGGSGLVIEHKVV